MVVDGLIDRFAVVFTGVTQGIPQRIGFQQDIEEGRAQWVSGIIHPGCRRHRREERILAIEGLADHRL